MNPIRIEYIVYVPLVIQIKIIIQIHIFWLLLAQIRMEIVILQMLLPVANILSDFQKMFYLLDVHSLIIVLMLT